MRWVDWRDYEVVLRGRLPLVDCCIEWSSAARISDDSVNRFILDSGFRDSNDGKPKNGRPHGPFVKSIVGAIMLIMVGACCLRGGCIG